MGTSDTLEPLQRTGETGGQGVDFYYFHPLDTRIVDRINYVWRNS